MLKNIDEINSFLLLSVSYPECYKKLFKILTTPIEQKQEVVLLLNDDEKAIYYKILQNKQQGDNHNDP